MMILRQSHKFEPSQAHFLPAIKTENKRTALGRSRETVLAPEMHKRMPGFECAPLAKRGEQDTPQEQLSLSAVFKALISCAVVP